MTMGVLVEIRDGSGGLLDSFVSCLHVDTVRGLYLSPSHDYEAPRDCANAAAVVCDDDGSVMVRFPIPVMQRGDRLTIGLPSAEQRAAIT